MINLYHYTSVDGFEGIVKNNSIRMTKSGPMSRFSTS